MSLLDLDIFFFLKDTGINITRKLNPLSENIDKESGSESTEAEVHLWGMHRVVDDVQEVGDDEGRPADDEDHVNLKLSEVGGSAVQIHDFHILIHVHYRR